LALTVAAVVMTISEIGPLHKAVWLILVFALMFLENKSIDKDRTQAKADQDAAFAIARKTAGDVTDTLTNLGLLGIQLDRVKTDLLEAQKNGNAKQIEQFKTEKKALQKQLLIAMTCPPSLVQG